MTKRPDDAAVELATLVTVDLRAAEALARGWKNMTLQTLHNPDL